MSTHNQRGEQAKEYFVKVEDKLKQVAINVSQLSPSLQTFKQIFDSMARQELEQRQLQAVVKETKQEVQAIKDIIVINPKAEWRDKTNRILNAIGYQSKEYQKARDEAYRWLEDRARCNLKSRLQNLKARALTQGMAPGKVKDLNMLDVIENDVRLKEIYIAIIKEMAIKYGVRV
jgi:anti-repressor protein